MAPERYTTLFAHIDATLAAYDAWVESTTSPPRDITLHSTSEPRGLSAPTNGSSVTAES